MPPSLTARRASLIVLALSLLGCTRSNGSLAEPSPAASNGHALSAQETQQAQTLHLGHKLYAQYCKLCHAAGATGYAADNAPSLVSQNFLASATDDFIARGIRFGRPGTSMGAYGKVRGGPLDDPQIDTIVAFLRSKGPPTIPLSHTLHTGDVTRAAALFEKHCASCHGIGGKQGTAVTLDNREFLAAAQPGFLRYAIEHGRPPTQMPAFADKLSAGELDDLVIWLKKLPPTGPAVPSVRHAAIPDDLPIVLNPSGKSPSFELRDGRFVSAEQVNRALAAKQRLIVVDARTPSDWVQFHIPGAISFPYYAKPELDRIPNDGTWVVAYCACPHHASGEVVDALRAANYPKTAVLDEGILGWRNLGYPLEGESVENPGVGAGTGKRSRTSRD